MKPIPDDLRRIPEATAAHFGRSAAARDVEAVQLAAARLEVAELERRAG